jgi:hypothetical protein
MIPFLVIQQLHAIPLMHQTSKLNATVCFLRQCLTEKKKKKETLPPTSISSILHATPYEQNHP